MPQMQQPAPSRRRLWTALILAGGLCLVGYVVARRITWPLLVLTEGGISVTQIWYATAHIAPLMLMCGGLLPIGMAGMAPRTKGVAFVICAIGLTMANVILELVASASVNGFVVNPEAVLVAFVAEWAICPIAYVLSSKPARVLRAACRVVGAVGAIATAVLVVAGCVIVAGAGAESSPGVSDALVAISLASFLSMFAAMLWPASRLGETD